MCELWVTWLLLVGDVLMFLIDLHAVRRSRPMTR